MLLCDETLTKEIEEKTDNLEKKIKEEKFKIFLSGKYDKSNAILSVYSGAGGVDAQDWATMLLRMYQRYCEHKGYKTKILHQSFGESKGPDGRIGTKLAAMEIKGKYVYGFIKKETGVHRLVRISPFSAQNLRHTSFALVEVLPDIGKEIEKEINVLPRDLKIETFRASGPGGQHVNKRESAIRITHMPSGITVSCQAERLQGLNKAKAMSLLCAKLYALKTREKKREIAQVKGESASIEWGSQIRSYVLHPYQLVKDHRTDYQTSNTKEVLDGRIEEFIKAEIKLQ